jgi:hypothetical protein
MGLENMGSGIAWRREMGIGIFLGRLLFCYCILPWSLVFLGTGNGIADETTLTRIDWGVGLSR